jgi:hypothetical protein
MDSWLNPLNKLRVQTAIRQEAHIVTLTDGRLITIEYLEDNKIWMQINKGEAPCGYFDRKVVMSQTMAGDYGVVDAEEEIFWSKVKQAYARVATNHDEEVVFTIGNREVSVEYRITFGVEPSTDHISIEVREINPPQPELIVPLGQGDD